MKPLNSDSLAPTLTNDDLFYNIYFDCGSYYNLMGIDKDELDIVVNAYLNGDGKFTLAGKEYSIHHLREIQIFTNEHESTPERFHEDCFQYELFTYDSWGNYLSPKILSAAGTNITKKIIGHKPYGNNKQQKKDEINKLDFIF